MNELFDSIKNFDARDYLTEEVNFALNQGKKDLVINKKLLENKLKEQNVVMPVHLRDADVTDLININLQTGTAQVFLW